MPDEVDNNTLLYAQAFAAVNHINFLNPELYQTEQYALKGQAIHAISVTLDDPEAAEVDGNIAAVLCMAVVAPLEVSHSFKIFIQFNARPSVEIRFEYRWHWRLF